VRSARLFRVEGRVQGVGFRWFVEREARAMGLAGYVKNLFDGAVEVYAVGPDEMLDRFRSRLEEGPLGARVRAVLESPAPVREHKGFHIAF
jgi:acylphosphatase